MALSDHHHHDPGRDRDHDRDHDRAPGTAAAADGAPRR